MFKRRSESRPPNWKRQLVGAGSIFIQGMLFILAALALMGVIFAVGYFGKYLEARAWLSANQDACGQPPPPHIFSNE